LKLIMVRTSEQTGRHLEGNSRLVVIHNAGHAVNLEKPTEVCKSIIEFFQEPVAEDSNEEMVCQPRDILNLCRCGRFRDHVALSKHTCPLCFSVWSHLSSLRLRRCRALIKVADGSLLDIGSAASRRGRTGERGLYGFSPFFHENIRVQMW
jgi:hypothetical protein